jgi:hypothetical protein
VSRRRDAEAVHRADNAAENARDREAMERLLAPDIRIEVNGRPALGSAEEEAAAMSALVRRLPDLDLPGCSFVEVAGGRITRAWLFTLEEPMARLLALALAREAVGRSPPALPRTSRAARTGTGAYSWTWHRFRSSAPSGSGSGAVRARRSLGSAPVSSGQ